jgi:hypothetical protein
MLVPGMGHLSLLALVAREDITGWVDRGMSAAVPLVLTDGAPLRRWSPFGTRSPSGPVREALPCP